MLGWDSIICEWVYIIPKVSSKMFIMTVLLPRIEFVYANFILSAFPKMLIITVFSLVIPSNRIYKLTSTVSYNLYALTCERVLCLLFFISFSVECISEFISWKLCALLTFNWKKFSPPLYPRIYFMKIVCIFTFSLQKGYLKITRKCRTLLWFMIS